MPRRLASGGRRSAQGDVRRLRGGVVGALAVLQPLAARQVHEVQLAVPPPGPCSGPHRGHPIAVYEPEDSAPLFLKVSYFRPSPMNFTPKQACCPPAGRRPSVCASSPTLLPPRTLGRWDVVRPLLHPRVPTLGFGTCEQRPGCAARKAEAEPMRGSTSPRRPLCHRLPRNVQPIHTMATTLGSVKQSKWLPTARCHSRQLRGRQPASPDTSAHFNETELKVEEGLGHHVSP